MISIFLVGSDVPACRSLREALRGEADLEVVGESLGGEATEQILKLRPAVVVAALAIDGQGLATVARIMHRSPRPVVMVTGERFVDPAGSARAMAAGALDVLPRLPPASDPAHAEHRAVLLRRIRVFAKVPVVTRTRSPLPAVPDAPPPATPDSTPSPLQPELRRRGRTKRAQVVVVGASTGGPPVLEEMFKALPKDFLAPVLVVQHMTSGFNVDFARWLSETSGRRVVLVTEPTTLEPGTVYLASDDRHLVLLSRTEAGASSAVAECFQRPSIDVLFRSAARAYGAATLGVLLTGMGCDGVAGLAELKGAGAVTLAQRLDTCAVDSMPRTAMERGLVDVAAAPDELASVIAGCA
ncbi:MAG: chemotaxis protein CheB [Myxococcales bacterium]